jgi:hypothetical protein
MGKDVIGGNRKFRIVIHLVIYVRYVKELMVF